MIGLTFSRFLFALVRTGGGGFLVEPQLLLEFLDSCRWREGGGEENGDEGGEHVQDKEEVVVDDPQDDVAEVEHQAGEDKGGG